MNRDRIWVIGTVAAIVIVAVFGYLVGISPIVAQAADANTSASTLSQANVASTASIAALKKQFADIATVRTQLASLRTSVPTGAEISTLITEINGLCADYSVKLKSLVVNDATIYVAPVTAAPVSPVGSTATPTPTPTPTAATPATTTPAAAPTTDSSALVLVPVILNVTGSFENVMKFIGGVQTGPRLFLVSEASVNPGGGDGSASASSNVFSATLTGNVFSTAGVSGALPENALPVTTPTDTPTTAPTTAPTSTPAPTLTPAP